MLVLECAHHKNEIDQNRRTLYHLKCFKEDVKKNIIKKHVFKNATLNKAKYRNFWGNLVIDLSQSLHEMIVQNLLAFDLPNIETHL